MSHQEVEQQSSLPGTAAGPEPAVVSGPGAELHYYFPIHVVLEGDIAEETRRDIAAEIWDALHAALS
jgi:hypothetical protein